MQILLFKDYDISGWFELEHSEAFSQMGNMVDNWGAQIINYSSGEVAYFYNVQTDEDIRNSVREVGGGGRY